MCADLDLTGGESDLLNNASDLTWRGSPMEDVYRRLSPWEFDYLPSIVNHRDHIVLYQLPWNKNATEPPSPHQSTLKWDSDHVRLPCSSRNEYKVKESVSERKSRNSALCPYVLNYMLRFD